MVIVTAAQAQDNLFELIEKAQREPVSIVQDGQPSAFLISERQMEVLQNFQPRRSDAAKALEAWAEKARTQRNPSIEELTEEEIVRLVHELR
jgi:prevent-host-death family protein